MNEELQQQLIAVLTAIKTNSPSLFNTIVEDTSRYYWTSVYVSIFTFIIGLICLYIASKYYKSEESYKMESKRECIFYPYMIFGFLFTFCSFISIITTIPHAVAPIGGMISKIS